MRLVTALAMAAAVLAAQQGAPVLVRQLPVGWTHALSDDCMLEPRFWARMLGAETLQTDAEVDGAAWGCLRQRGLASRSPLVKIVLPTWPSQAELASWAAEERPDEDSLPAGLGHPRHLPASTPRR